MTSILIVDGGDSMKKTVANISYVIGLILVLTVTGCANFSKIDKPLSQCNELVVFDVNRSDQATAFYPAGDAATLDALEKRADLACRLTIIAIATPDSSTVARRSKAPRSPDVDILSLGMVWPSNVYSLAHVAIPFPPDDARSTVSMKMPMMTPTKACPSTG